MAMTETESPLADAREAVSNLFDMIGITRVVVVDDKYSASSGVEDILGVFISLINDGKASIVQQIECLSDMDVEEDDQDVLRKFITSRLESSDEPTRKSVAVQLADFADGKDDHENATRTGLEELLEAYEVLQLSLADWLEQRESLLTVESAAKTLFLFDQDMSAGDGRENQGMEIIRDILQNKDAPAIYCGLFSHTVPANHEYNTWNELSQQHELGNEKHRFVVLAKAHLLDDPWAFACRLKRVAITARCDDLKSMVTEVLDGAHAAAKQKLSELSIYDFEQIVFQSSFEEGVWEADTVIRLFGLFQRHSARDLSKKHASISDVARDVRRVVRYPYKPDDAPKSTSCEIRRIELYENGDFLNGHHFPIELGELFQKTKGKRRFVVIAQPCELMVRSDGRRQSIGHVFLAEIFHDKPNESGAFFELPYLDETDYSSGWVRLHTSSPVDVQILDLAVFQDDGVCRANVEQAVPGRLIPAWENRFTLLQDDYKGIISQFEKMFPPENGKPGQAGRVAQCALSKSVEGIVSGIIRGRRKEVVYDLKRIGRVKEPMASSMLRSYSAYMSRDAFEHDFAKGVARESVSLRE